MQYQNHSGFECGFYIYRISGSFHCHTGDVLPIRKVIRTLNLLLLYYDIGFPSEWHLKKQGIRKLTDPR